MEAALPTFECSGCGRSHTSTPLPPKHRAFCSRCGNELAKRQGRSHSYLSALATTALVCWALTLWMPIASVEKLGLQNKGYLVQLGSSFRDHGQLALGLAVDLFAVALPTVLFLCLPVAAASPNYPGLARLCAFAKRWAMPEVFMLAVVVSFTKIGALADASLSLGFWALVVGTILLIHVLQNLPLPHPAIRKDRSTAIALLIAACIALVPANLLPIMTVARGPKVESNTIIGGIAELFASGMWGIALIVLIASILVPFLKLGGLAWLLLVSRKQAGTKRAVQTYNVIEFIGRWSMLDIFLIGVLAGLIEFGNLAYVRPGPAAPMFAAAVVLTVLAVERFDTKSLFRLPAKKADNP